MNEPRSERVARYYRNDDASVYHRYQLQGAEVKACLNTRKFQPHIPPESFVVDFGCGPGLTLAALDAARKLGVEVNPHNRRIADSIGIPTVSSPDELPTNAVDVVISNHALEHTTQPYTELRALRKALRPGGTLVLCVPADDWRTQRKPLDEDPNHHLYTWTPLSLTNLLVEAGFEVRESGVSNYGWPGRLTYPLGRYMPPTLFELTAYLTAVVLRRRELRALAVAPLT